MYGPIAIIFICGFLFLIILGLAKLWGINLKQSEVSSFNKVKARNSSFSKSIELIINGIESSINKAPDSDLFSYRVYLFDLYLFSLWYIRNACISKAQSPEIARAFDEDLTDYVIVSLRNFGVQYTDIVYKIENRLHYFDLAYFASSFSIKGPLTAFFEILACDVCNEKYVSLFFGRSYTPGMCNSRQYATLKVLSDEALEYLDVLNAFLDENRSIIQNTLKQEVQNYVC